MRTTVTLDPDVERLLREAAHRERKPFKAVLNEAVRRGLGPRAAAPSRAVVLPVHHASLAPGVDPRGMNQLADELEDDALIDKIRRDLL